MPRIRSVVLAAPCGTPSRPASNPCRLCAHPPTRPPPPTPRQAGESWMPNPVIAEALRSAPRAGGVETPLQRPISLRNLLPRAREADGRRPYVNYAGSLTTPPCSTGVDWYVFLDPLQVRAGWVVGWRGRGACRAGRGGAAGRQVGRTACLRKNGGGAAGQRSAAAQLHFRSPARRPDAQPPCLNPFSYPPPLNPTLCTHPPTHRSTPSRWWTSCTTLAAARAPASTTARRSPSATASSSTSRPELAHASARR